MFISNRAIDMRFGDIVAFPSSVEICLLALRLDLQWAMPSAIERCLDWQTRTKKARVKSNGNLAKSCKTLTNRHA
jgi:hypothetical protein